VTTDLTWLVDLSNWNAGVDVGQIAAEGYSAAICKATEGVTWRDGQFDTWIPRIAAAGMIPGAYHYLRAGDGYDQAHAFHDRIRDHGGPNGWIIAVDNEKDANLATTTMFVDVWNAITDGHPILMYTGSWWWTPRAWNGVDLTPDLWHSHYVTGTDLGSRLYEKVPADWWTPGYGGWPTATLLQFTSSGLVAGRPLDVSAFRGNRTELAATLCVGGGTPSGPAPLIVDGVFGPRTCMALQRYLNTAGEASLVVDGVFGILTRKALQEYLDVRQDGIIGPITIRALQRHTGAKVDGIWGPDTTRHIQRALNNRTF
jgi:hypothetical protein